MMEIFIEKVTKLNPDILPISDYSKNYLQRLIKELPYRVHIYKSILDSVLNNIKKPLHEISLLDFGGGTGLLSCFAKFMGVKNVFYLDIFEPSVLDATIIAKALDLEANGYYNCSISELPTKPDVIVSMDVIEHVYNLELFIRDSFQLNSEMIHVHVTGANPYNPIIRNRLMKIQIRNEYQNRPKPEAAKPSDNFHSFFELRKNFIQKNTDWNEDLISEIAKLTRGMIYPEILFAIQLYNKEGVKPSPIAHPTNTCDPETGNWSERLVSIQEFETIAKNNSKILKYSSIGYNTYRKSAVLSLFFIVINYLCNNKLGRFFLPLVKIELK